MNGDFYEYNQQWYAFNPEAYKYYDPALYGRAFYIEHQKDSLFKKVYKGIRYDKSELKDYFLYKCADGYEGEFEDEEDVERQTRDFVLSYIKDAMVFFEPLKFDIRAANTCDLIPFTFKGLNLLACFFVDGIESSPGLDYYQMIVHNTLNNKSKFLSQDTPPNKGLIGYYEGSLGKDKVEGILKLIDNKRKGY